MPFSARSRVARGSTPLARAQAQHGSDDLPVVDWTVSNPTLVNLSFSAYEGNHGERLPYEAEALGDSLARRAIARHWHGSHPPRPDQLLLAPSSSELYHYLFTLLCDPGDEVLAPEPSYPLFSHIARYSSVALRSYRLNYDGAWHVDFDSLEAAIGPRTRAVLSVSPNNPTGSYLDRSELKRLASLGLPLISDEVFARYELDGRGDSPASAFGESELLTFCIDGLSKSAGLPQLKLSWMALGGPEREVEEGMHRLGWIADTYLSTAGPVQRSLPDLLQRAPLFRRDLLSRLQANLRQLRATLQDSAATVLRTEGGWYAVVRLPDVASDERWAFDLLRRQNVTVHPGYFYDLNGPPHCVVSLLGEEATFCRAARALLDEVEHKIGDQKGN